MARYKPITHNIVNLGKFMTQASETTKNGINIMKP